MDLIETFGKAVNTSFVSVTDSLRFLGITESGIEEAVKKKKHLIPQKTFDIAVDYKPKINQLYLYLVSKKSGKKLIKSFKPNKLDFARVNAVHPNYPINERHRQPYWG